MIWCHKSTFFNKNENFRPEMRLNVFFSPVRYFAGSFWLVSWSAFSLTTFKTVRGTSQLARSRVTRERALSPLVTICEPFRGTNGLPWLLFETIENHPNKRDGWNFWKPVTFIPTIPLRICLSPSIHPSYSDVLLIRQLSRVIPKLQVLGPLWYF